MGAALFFFRRKRQKAAAGAKAREEQEGIPHPEAAELGNATRHVAVDETYHTPTTPFSRTHFSELESPHSPQIDTIPPTPTWNVARPGTPRGKPSTPQELPGDYETYAQNVSQAEELDAGNDDEGLKRNSQQTSIEPDPEESPIFGRDEPKK